MGVKYYEDLLCRVANNYVNDKLSKDFLIRAAILYARAKSKACDRRDRWKMKKRLEDVNPKC